MTTLFVTSSGTDIGKTHVCCRLVESLRSRVGLRCIKPVVSGFDPQQIDASDTARLIRAQGLSPEPGSIDATSPWRFRAAVSADMAAARENRTIPFAELLAFCRAESGAELTLIEGIGGVMAPIDDANTVLDWIAALDTKTLLVVGSYLGSLSHSLTAIDVLTRRARRPIAIVVSQSEAEPVPTEETAACLARHCDEIPVTIMWRDDEQRTDEGFGVVERALGLAEKGRRLPE
jgi:dethiobiotin synthetase